MREEDRMIHLDKVEKIASMCGFENRRENVRSLQIVKILDPISKEWILFDPIFQGKDVAKMMWGLAASLDGFEGNEIEFRTELLDWVLKAFEESTCTK